jgi:hypothetical protein
VSLSSHNHEQQQKRTRKTLTVSFFILPEIFVWTGIFISCCSTFMDEQGKFASIISPVTITSSLLFLSGITRLEEAADKRYGNRDDYREYKRRTSPLIPIPPIFFGCCANALKCFLCCEFPMYNYLDQENEALSP